MQSIYNIPLVFITLSKMQVVKIAQRETRQSYVTLCSGLILVVIFRETFI